MGPIHRQFQPANADDNHQSSQYGVVTMRPLANAQGFTLLEVVIALAIFSIGIVALYGIQTLTITQNFSANRITTASSWASKKMEELHTIAYQDLEDVNNDGEAGLGNDTIATADGNDISSDGVYTILWNVAEDVPIPRTKTIRVIVTSQRAGTGNRVDMEFIKHAGI